MSKKNKAKNNRKNRYCTDAEKSTAIAMWDACQSTKEVAKEFGVTTVTVNKWIKDRDKFGNVDLDKTVADKLALLQDLKAENLGKMIELQAKALKQVESTLGKANAVQSATVFGILHDKMSKSQNDNSNKGGNTTNIILNNMDDGQATALMERVIARSRNGQDVTK